jgi:cytochrome c553
MKFALSGCLSLVLTLTATAAPGANNDEAGRMVSQVCALCHGPDGNSTSPLFPRLAAQSSAYLETQLKAFRDHRRADPPAQAYMWGITSQLDDAQITRLAAYFASQPAKPVAPTSPLRSDEGKTLYESGAPGQGIVACASCHGDANHGNTPFPRLAGQHPEYILKQLLYFKSRLRSTDPVMLDVCDRLTNEQIRALAVYAASR